MLPRNRENREVRKSRSEEGDVCFLKYIERASCKVWRISRMYCFQCLQHYTEFTVGIASKAGKWRIPVNAIVCLLEINKKVVDLIF